MYLLRLLGSIDLTHPAGHRIVSVLSQAKQVGLLVLLILQRGRPLSRQWAASLLWPESDTQRSRSSMRTALHRLRRSLHPDLVESYGDVIVVNESMLWCDLWEMETRLTEGEVEEALALYQGPLANDLPAEGALALARHLEDERSALEWRVTQRGLERIDELIAVEEAASALAIARRLTHLQPLDEMVFRKRLRALAAAGNYTGVVTAAEEFTERIREDLGVEPAPGTLALVEELTSGGGVEGAEGRRSD